MLNQYFWNKDTYLIEFKDMHSIIEKQLMGDGSPHGIKNA